jgi:bifunctional DNA-binding transcriptional regulator/antitoxin component of YhaV-PrlF toxin-antitoxin module
VPLREDFGPRLREKLELILRGEGVELIFPEKYPENSSLLDKLRLKDDLEDREDLEVLRN